MSKRLVTIRMPRNLKNKWLRALRSGKYRQGEDALRQWEEAEDGSKVAAYCCLGLLQHVAGKRKIAGGLPSLTWLSRHGITFRTKGGTKNCRNPDLGRHSSAAEMNDDGVPFCKIADAIEKVCVGYH